MNRRQWCTMWAAWFGTVGLAWAAATNRTEGPNLIRSYSYDERTQTLTIVLEPDGATYHFFGVMPKVYRDFAASRAKGTFFVQYIRGRYEFRKE